MSWEEVEGEVRFGIAWLLFFDGLVKASSEEDKIGIMKYSI